MSGRRADVKVVHVQRRRVLTAGLFCVCTRVHKRRVDVVAEVGCAKRGGLMVRESLCEGAVACELEAKGGVCRSRHHMSNHSCGMRRTSCELRSRF